MRKLLLILAGAVFLLTGVVSPSVAQNATGTIKLKKVFVPGSDQGHFHLIIKDANGTVVNMMQNAGHNQALGPVTVPVGTYTVSETQGFYTVGTDYTSAISGAGCNANGTVTVTAGSNITCIITNTRNPPGTITVYKVTVPANVPERFTLQITSSYPQLLANFLNAHAPAQMGPVTLSSGSTYTISEIAGTGTNMADFSQTITGPGCTNGIVNLTPGANIVCTITNTKITCTGWPLQATVDIYYAGIPSAQQTVHICRGGKVKIINHTSTPLTVQWTSGPTSFTTFPVAIAGNSLTPLLPTTGNENYKVNGSSLNPTAVKTGLIVIH